LLKRPASAPAVFGFRSIPEGEEMSAGESKLRSSAGFERIYERLRGRVHRLALRITRNRQDAEDVVQECFMHAFLHLGEFSGRSKLSTWISRIAINEALMKIRKSSRCEFSLDDIKERSGAGLYAELSSDFRAPDQQLMQRERERILAEGLKQLSPRLWKVAELYYFRGLAARECAETLGISLSNAKARILRARLKLRPACERRLRGEIVSFRPDCHRER